MSNIKLAGLVVVAFGALWVAGCANESTGPDEPTETGDSTANHTRTPDETPAPVDAAQFEATHIAH